MKENDAVVRAALLVVNRGPSCATRLFQISFISASHLPDSMFKFTSFKERIAML